MLNRYNGEEKVALAGLAIIGIWILVYLAMVTGLIYVAIHFISKYW